MFRKFLEWIYLFDFISGDLAHAMFYYLHPKETREMLYEIEKAFRDDDKLEMVLDVIEKKRMKVLLDKSDPSWTEHFAELQNEIRELWNK